MANQHPRSQAATCETETGLGIWFWLLLAALIFVLYCLVLQRPYC